MIPKEIKYNLHDADVRGDFYLRTNNEELQQRNRRGTVSRQITWGGA